MKEILVKSLFLSETRKFFETNNFLEVMTPVVTKHPGAEVYLEYFDVSCIKEGRVVDKAYLRSSPEIGIKAYLTELSQNMYEIAPCFRNGREYSPWHNPEFLMLEYYKVDTSFQSFIDFTTEYFLKINESIKCKYNTVFNERDFNSKAKKFSVKEVFSEFLKVDLIDGDPELSWKLQSKVVSVTKDDDFSTAYYKAFIDVLEPTFAKLGVVVLYDYPVSQAALSAVEHGVAKRFEFYLNGIEICNAFFELSDAHQNKQRLTEINAKRSEIGKNNIDYSSVIPQVCQKNLPNVCGNAVGVERLLSVLLGMSSIDLFRSKSGFADFY